MREEGRRVGVLAGLAILVSAGSAGAATLKAEYQLQGTRVSAVAGAPDLVDVGSSSRFVTEPVDGVARRVLAFRRGGGLSLATRQLVDPQSHSFVMVFRLDEVSGFRRLLDFGGGSSDPGVYNLDGQVVMYPLAGAPPELGAAITPGSYVQLSLTTERTLAGSQWTVVYINGSPVVGTAQGFSLRSGVLRLFKDNVRGSSRGEEAAGALACLLVYDGALTTAEVTQQAADPASCPAPRPAPPPDLAFRPGDYRGTTSQGLLITFSVGATSVDGIAFRWRARCADGRIHTNGIFLGAAAIREGRFSAAGSLGTGGRARVSGRVRGSRARGTLSRWANSAFNTVCVARGVRWRAHLVRGARP